VDGAIFISPFSMYKYDGSYAVEVQKAHPDKFALVKPVDPDDPKVADVIAGWKETPGTVGIRIIMTKESNRAPDHPGFDRIIGAAVKHDFPVNVLFWGNVDAIPGPISRRWWISPSARTPLSRSAAPARCPSSPIPFRTSGTRSSASSTPG